jgi:hypothetical protein
MRWALLPEVFEPPGIAAARGGFAALNLLSYHARALE